MIKCDPRAKAKCPFKNPCCGDDVAYFVEGSECDEFNRKVLAPPPTNSDRIGSMTTEEKAEFISGIAYGRETPWCEPFAEKFCKTCPEPEYTLEDGRKMNLHECDFTDGKCPHGSSIVWWLQQPAEDDGHA